MRPLSLVLSISLLALATDAVAQDRAPYPPADTGAIQSVQVTAQQPGYWLGTEQAQTLGGYYVMSNGWRMKVRTGARHIDATIDDRPPMRLVALSPDLFASRDGNTTMEFNRGEAGDEMVMSYRPDPLLAEVVVVKATLAQR